MYEEGHIRVTHRENRAPSIQVTDTGPMSLYEALNLAEEIRGIARLGIIIEFALLVATQSLQ